MVQKHFLITGSDEICEVVKQADLLKAVHDMFCCCGVIGCDNCYVEAFKEEYKDGVDFEGWRESLEDGWLNVEGLPSQPKQMAALERTVGEMRKALEEYRSLDHRMICPSVQDAARLNDLCKRTDALLAPKQAELCECGQPENSIRHSFTAAKSIDAHQFKPQGGAK
jgi:hypothetical protein